MDAVAPGTKFGYVAVLGKPWGVVSNTFMVVDTRCQLLLYRGSFSIEDMAALITPLGAGELTTLPGSDDQCFSWTGMVACTCWQALLLFLRLL
jgi:hypothetical protein